MAIFSTVFTAISGLFASITASAFGAFALRAVVSLGLNAIARALAGKPKEQAFGIKGQLQRGADLPQSFMLGSGATSGSLAYANTWAPSNYTPNTFVTLVIAVSDLPVQSLDAIWVNGEKCTIGATADTEMDRGYPVEEYHRAGYDYLWVKFYDGTQTAADTLLTSRVSSDERPWDASAVGHGIAYTVVTARINREVFTGFPQLLFEITGLPLYDPSRDSSVGGVGPHRLADPATWGGDGDHLPAVQAYNLLHGIRHGGEWIYGLQDVSAAQLPVAHWIQQIEICRAEVQAQGGTEPAYRAAGEVPVNAPVRDVMQALMDASNGRMSEAGGTFKLFAGPPSAPVAVFDDTHIISTSAQTFSPFFGLSDTVNGISAQFPSPVAGWQTEAAPPLYRSDYETEDGGRRLMAEVTLSFVPYAEQVQRLMLSALREARRSRRHTLTLPPEFWPLEPGDVVAWTSERNGYDAKLFRVDGFVDLPNADVVVDLTEVDPTDYDFDTDVDFTPVVTPGTIPPPLVSQPVLGFSVAGASIADPAGTSRRPAIRASWIAGVDDIAAIRFEVRLAATDEVVLTWRSDSFAEGSDLISGAAILPDTAYEVRARYVPEAPRPTEWTLWKAVTTPDDRLGVSDLLDDLTAKIDAAFDRHDAVIEDATGTVGDLRDRVFGMFGVGPFEVVPLAELMESVYGPLDPLDPPEVSLDARIDIERDRLDFEIPVLRNADDALDDIWERLIGLEVDGFDFSRRLSDAGIVVDPESGTVSIRAVEAVAGRQSAVEIALDAAQAQLSLTASRSYVDGKVSDAMLDPTSIPIVDDLTLRLSDVEVQLDAETGRIDLLSDTLTVEGGLVSMATVTAELDSLAEAMTLRVTSDDFDAEVSRLNAVEVQLSTLGDVSALTETVTASRALADGLDDLTEASISDLWERWRAGEAIREASAAGQRQLRASVDEDFAAEASERLRLAAQIDMSTALIEQEALTRATETSALGQLVNQIDVALSDPDSGLAATATALDDTISRVAETEDGLEAESARTDFLGAAVSDLEILGDGETEAGIVELWNRTLADATLRDGVAVRLREADARVVEGLVAEASERLVLGAALADTTATLIEEQTARATADRALTQQIVQLEGRVGDAEGDLTDLNTVDVTSTSALVQSHLGLTGRVDDAEGALTQLNTVNVTSGSALVQSHLGLTGRVDDAEGALTQLDTVDVTSTSALVQSHLGLTGRVADAEGDLTDLNTVEVTSTSALVQAHLGLTGRVDDAEGALTQLNTVNVTSESALVQSHLGLWGRVGDAEGALTQLETVDVSSTSALVQSHLGLTGRVGSAEGALTDLNTVDVSSQSALVQSHLGLTGRVEDAEGELTDLNTVNVTSGSALVQSHLGLTGRVEDAEGSLTQLDTVDVSSTSALVQSHLSLTASIEDPETGLAARVTGLDAVGGRVDQTESGLEVLSARAEVLEAAIGTQQVIPNGDFSAGDLRGWAGVPAEWAVIQRGSTAATAVQNAPRLFMLSIDQSADMSQATAVADVPVEPGGQFTVSLWGASWGSGHATAQVRFVWVDATGAELGTVSSVEHSFTSQVWAQVDLGSVTVPANAASVQIRLRRPGGGVGKLYLASVRVERLSAAELSAKSRIETIEGSYVDEDGAVAAVEARISAEYGDLAAMAEATSFAKATADGIAAGYVWRLNGENLMEAVSVSDGTGGPVSTFRLAADYVQITGITQIETGVITDLVASEAFLDNVTIGRGQIEDVLKSDNYLPGVRGISFDFRTGAAEVNSLRVRQDMVVGGAIGTGELAPGAVSDMLVQSGTGPIAISVPVPADDDVRVVVLAVADNIVSEGAGTGRAGLRLRQSGTQVREVFVTRPDLSPGISRAEWAGSLAYGATLVATGSARNVTFEALPDGAVTGQVNMIIFTALR